MLVIGIDPGLTGAVGVLKHGRFVAVHDMPTIAPAGGAKVKNVVNPAGLASLLRQIIADHPGEAVRVALERVASMPGQGVASVFSLGDSFGAIRAVVAVLHLQTHFMPPAAWKRTMKIGSDNGACRSLAIQLFPEAPLHRIKDHNRAEALLLAECLRREIE